MEAYGDFSRLEHRTAGLNSLTISANECSFHILRCYQVNVNIEE